MPAASYLTWGSTSVTLNIGDIISVSYTDDLGFSPNSAGVESRLNGIATANVVAASSLVEFTGVTAGSVTIPADVDIGNGVITSNALTLTVTAPADDDKFLNKRGLTHFWDNIDSAKQDKLTAGSNITISNGTISATVPTRTTIYNNGTGTNANFSTTSAMSNYDDVEITFRDANSNYATLTVPGSAGSFVLNIVHPGASSIAYWYISRFIVSGTGITVGANNMRKALQATGLTTTAAQDIYVTKMVGIKY